MKELLKTLYYKPSINNLVLKLLSPVLPPPYAQHFMEFKYGVWQGISSIHTTTGRQLGENNTEPFYRKQKIATEYHSSKQSGSRFGLTMNMSALKHVMKNWDESLSLMLSLRNHFIQQLNIESESLTLLQLYLFAKYCSSLPAYMVRVNRSRIKDGNLDECTSTLFQLISGVFMIVRRMIERSEPWLNLSACMSPDELYEYAEKYNIFTSSDGSVCGGTKRKIIELLAVSLSGHKEGTSYQADEKLLFSRIVNPDHLLAYSLTAVHLEICINQFKAKSALIFLTIDKAKLVDGGKNKKDLQSILEGGIDLCENNDGNRLKLIQKIEVNQQLAYSIECQQSSDNHCQKAPLEAPHLPQITEGEVRRLPESLAVYTELLEAHIIQANHFHKKLNRLLGFNSQRKIPNSLVKRVFQPIQSSRLKHLLSASAGC